MESAAVAADRTAPRETSIQKEGAMNLWSPAPFPKIPMYRGEADPLYELRRVVCLEKIDGTNTRVGVPFGAKHAADIVIGGRELTEREPGFSQPFLCELVRQDDGLCKK